EVLQIQLKKLETLKKNRSQSRVRQALQHLSKACRDEKENILERAIEAARNRATLGEISSAIEKVFGRYHAPAGGLSKIYAAHSMNNRYFKKACKLVLDFEKKFGRRPRILIAKMGQDGHDRGARIIASGFADLGFDVDMGPLFQTPAETARHAMENDVHFIGVSSLAGAHQALIPELIGLLKEKGRDDIAVIAGGIIPDTDARALFDKGVLAVFGPGTNLAKAAVELMKLSLRG
ncbi:MAG TPA: methylmalonyl-CoA mutase family protein, partial [Saprospiraceae bacterium]|nr:methylmalonyl-CoA mutase family protein [Saprospiraceae bacterium]